MKKNLFNTLLVIVLTLAGTPAIMADEPTIVYYMPKTTIMLEANYTQHNLLAGPFAEFAAEMLGATDYIPTTSTYYELNEIRTGIRTTTDHDRAFRLSGEDINQQFIRLDKNGILLGYNLPKQHAKHHDTPAEEPTEESTVTNLSRPMPILEDMFGVTDRRQLAESIARQIMRIRETRIYVLGGEVEHAPADGLAMQQVLDELNRQEQEMTELFIGRHTEVRKTGKFYYTPTDSRVDTVAYFSTTMGLSHDSTIDTTPITIDIECFRQEQPQPEQPEKSNKALFNKAPQASQFYYNLPGHADYTVLYDGRVMAERQIPVAQLGVALPLAKQLFQQKSQPVIMLDGKTGNIVEIRK